jgi:transposase, IS5 family
MSDQRGLFDVDLRLAELSAKGDDLERLKAVVDFEIFRADLERAVPRSDRAKGGRPAYDHVLMFKILVLQSAHTLSDERTEYLIRDRLSFMRFLGLSLTSRVPDANSIWNFREALTKAVMDGKPAIEVLFKRFDAALNQAGFIAMGGQIIDATIVAAPKQRNTQAEKREIKEGRIPEEWKKSRAKLAQKDRDARWTVKHSKAKPVEGADPKAKRIDIAIPMFGYKNHVGIDRRHGLIRTWVATDAARHDGAQLPNLLSKENTASDVWADTAYRSQKNEEHLAKNGFKSRIHRKKPKGKPMSDTMRQANAEKSKVRSHVEHVFGREKGPMALVIRTIGIARAKVKIGLANLVYNMTRLRWLNERPEVVA